MNNKTPQMHSKLPISFVEDAQFPGNILSDDEEDDVDVE